MPCGGIYPLPKGDLGGDCFVCGNGNARHFCEEWDCFIHAKCALLWLANEPEGRTVVKHGHLVTLKFNHNETTDGEPANADIDDWREDR